VVVVAWLSRLQLLVHKDPDLHASATLPVPNHESVSPEFSNSLTLRYDVALISEDAMTANLMDSMEL
jgi:hypothetical protein